MSWVTKAYYSQEIILKKEKPQNIFYRCLFSYCLFLFPPVSFHLFPKHTHTHTHSLTCNIKSSMENGKNVLLFPSNFHITYGLVGGHWGKILWPFFHSEEAGQLR